MSGRLEGWQSWTGLLFLHWAVEPSAVRPAVPAELPLDLRDGKAWLGVVAFRVEAARPPGVPAPIGLHFLEVNARTYVRRPGGAAGVYFFSLEAESALAVAGARRFYGLPYHRARMSRAARPEGWMDYRSARRSPAAPGLRVRYRAGEPAGTAAPGSLEEFLVERYVLHTVRGGAVGTVRVRHAPYPLRRVEVDLQAESLLAAAGLVRPEAAPLAHFSDGVDVHILREPTERGARARYR